ncbi:MAG TPA: hypothetical protein DD666_00735 [Advenella kashmirensis]|uniref:Phage replication protein n=1 Tax=Advenella kashmirensis TaxID=310575 RepID=A0A356LBN2_9BURK|nr:hypothetical protein [Advenella kashmirensis]
MARARNIKPGFFTNDNLADINPLGRLLFIGLWTICDRSGRLEDRHRKIKAEVLPYDNCDADELLSELEKHGFILRYTSGDDRYIQVLNFNKHQNPHVKETESTIPAPDLYCANSDQDQNEPTTNPADSLLLNPSSLNPITESNENASVPESGSAPVVESGKPAAKQKYVSIADLTALGVDEQVASEFNANRKRKLTPLALAGIQREAGKAGWSLEDALRKAVERGWQSFEAAWVAQDKNAGPPANRNQKYDPKSAWTKINQGLSNDNTIDIHPSLAYQE